MKPGPDQDTSAYAAEAAKMNDDELMDTWETASDQERKSPSALLEAVMEEMRARDIPLRHDCAGEARATGGQA